MKASVLGYARQSFIREVEDAKADLGHVLIKVKRAAICGSDKSSWRDGLSPDTIKGHEYAGDVIDPGPRTDLKAGDRVTSITQNPCMQCEYCKAGDTADCSANAWFPGSTGIPGAFAEMFAARADLVCKLEDSMSYEEGALIEPLAVCWHAIKKVNVKKGDKVLVSGVGCLGAYSAMLAKYLGASLVVITDMSDARAKQVIEFGDADEFVNITEPALVSRLKAISSGGFDVYIDTAGDINNMSVHMQGLKKNRTGVAVGFRVGDKGRMNMFDLLMSNQTLMGSYAFNNDEFIECLKLVADKKIDPVKYVGRHFPLEQAQEAYLYAESRSTLDLKVMLDINS